MTRERVTVVGGGLAGCEAGWQLAERGIRVTLFEMRPEKQTPAHKTGTLAEIVCSNSFRSDLAESAPGLLKREMEALDSLIIKKARSCAVPGGKSLVFERERFAQSVQEAVESHPRIEVIRGEIKKLPEPPVILATGPLTSESLAEDLASKLGGEPLHFYDAIAPIVDGESLDRSVIFSASRYDEGEDSAGDYLNAPMNKEEYLAFIEVLRSAGIHAGLEEDRTYFERCMPIEEMARRGIETPRYGPMKPVGLTDPRTGRWPYAVVQLRREDLHGEHYNLVGFQTQLTIPEQVRVLRMIPGMERAAIVRHGSVHRNTFIEAPRFLGPDLMLRDHPGLWIAGQLSGVEGYIESAAAGLAAGIFAAARLRQKEIEPFPQETMIGGLLRYISNSENKKFQPMKVNLALLPDPEPRPRCKHERRTAKINTAHDALQRWRERNNDGAIGDPKT